MIHVCYVTNDGYCSHAAVSAVSVFENNRNDDVCVHILAENISEESRRRLEAAADPYPRGQIDIIDCTGYVERIQKEYAPTRISMYLQKSCSPILTAFCGLTVIWWCCLPSMSCGRQTWRAN